MDETKVTITWVPEDVQDLVDGMTIEEASDFLDRNRKHIRDRSIEFGWTVMETLLNIEEEDAND